jgi:tRNA (guanosine-2'-O-)-methyltransferase
MRYALTDERRQKIERVLAMRQKDLTLVMDNIWDPHNVSAILRSCDAFGVSEVQLYYTTHAFPDVGRKSSASARKWVARHRHENRESLAAFIEARGFALLATGFSERARPLADWDLSRPTAVILSNEHAGISEELLPLTAGEVYIPMRGMIPSLNVSVAAAIILYEAARQRAAKGLYDRPSFGPEELLRLTEDWSSR